jgi:ferrochelatase
MSKAILLINLGSPDSTSVADVRKYLSEFLTDPRVIDIGYVRKVIVPLIILNTRPRKSAEAYASIWTENGSPLVATTLAQANGLSQHLEDSVYVAMRYGNPSIDAVVKAILDAGHDEVFCLPLYPQYAMSSYETVVVKVMEVVNALKPDLRIEFLQPFYNDPDYLDVLARHITSHLSEDFDRLLFSFHGIPERHLRVSDPSHAHCLCVEDCCHRPNPAHGTCYRHQCFATVREVSSRLNVPDEKIFTSFQSRLGRDPWLTPYTDRTLEEWARSGIKRVRVVCPAFVTDCLETIEEIAEEAREIFLDAGGEDFALIPCLNEDPGWLEFLANRCKEWSVKAVV